MPGNRAVYAAPFSWTGFYIGANVGYSWGRADTDVSATSSTRVRRFDGASTTPITDVTIINPSFLASGSDSVDGVIGGGQLGYNVQSGRWVLGLEADLQASGERGDASFCSGTCATGSTLATAHYKLDYLGTVRGRAGFLLDPKFLAYATGGLAYGGFDTDYTTGVVGSTSPLAFSDSTTKAGWTVGAGLEKAIDRNWLLRLEYLYVDLGKVADAATSTTVTTTTGNRIVLDATSSSAMSTHFTDQIVRVGISYKFGEREYAPLK